MKKLLLILMILLLCGCSKEKENRRILKTIEIDTNQCERVEEKDSHGGFLNDGVLYIQFKCQNLTKENLSTNWKELPISEEIEEKALLDFCNDEGCYDFKEYYHLKDIEKGYYFFQEKNYNEVSYTNYILATYDEEKEIIHYIKFDS